MIEPRLSTPAVSASLGLSPASERAVVACWRCLIRVGCIPRSIRGIEQASGVSPLTAEDFAEALRKHALVPGPFGMRLNAEHIRVGDPETPEEASALTRVMRLLVITQSDDDEVAERSTRSISPWSFFTDERVHALPERAQHVLLRMLLSCDEDGYGPGTYAEIAEHLGARWFTPDVQQEVLEQLLDARLVDLVERDASLFYQVLGYTERSSSSPTKDQDQP